MSVDSAFDDNTEERDMAENIDSAPTGVDDGFDNWGDAAVEEQLESVDSAPAGNPKNQDEIEDQDKCPVDTQEDTKEDADIKDEECPHVSKEELERQGFLKTIHDLQKQLKKAKKEAMVKSGRAKTKHNVQTECPVCLEKGVTTEGRNKHYYNKINKIIVDKCPLVKDMDIEKRMQLFKAVGLCFLCSQHRYVPGQKCTGTTHPSGQCTMCPRRYWCCLTHRETNWPYLVARDEMIKKSG